MRSPKVSRVGLRAGRTRGGPVGGWRLGAGRPRRVGPGGEEEGLRGGGGGGRPAGESHSAAAAAGAASGDGPGRGDLTWTSGAGAQAGGGRKRRQRLQPARRSGAERGRGRGRRSSGWDQRPGPVSPSWSSGAAFPGRAAPAFLRPPPGLASLPACPCPRPSAGRAPSHLTPWSTFAPLSALLAPPAATAPQASPLDRPPPHRSLGSPFPS